MGIERARRKRSQLRSPLSGQETKRDDTTEEFIAQEKIESSKGFGEKGSVGSDRKPS
jgi:hypothetical protein